MTIAKTVKFCKIDDDDFIYLTDGKRRNSDILMFSMRKVRKCVDMSIEVIHAEMYYPYCCGDGPYFLLTIRTRDFEFIKLRKDWWM